MRAFDEIDRARNDARDRVLQRESLLGPATVGDVAREAARMNKLAAFEVRAGIDANGFDRAVFITQPRLVIADDFTSAQSLENVFDGFTVVMELDDVAADVLFARVAEQVEFGLIRAQDRSIGADPVQ